MIRMANENNWGSSMFWFELRCFYAARREDLRLLLFLFWLFAIGFVVSLAFGSLLSAAGFFAATCFFRIRHSKKEEELEEFRVRVERNLRDFSRGSSFHGWPDFWAEYDLQVINLIEAGIVKYANIRGEID